MQMEAATHKRGLLYTLLAFLLAVPASAQAASINNLMPQPAHLEQSTGSFTLTPSFAIAANLQDPRLTAAIDRTRHRLEERTGLHLSPTSGTPNQPGLTLTVGSPGQPVQSLDEDESYQLTVTPQAVKLTAPTTVGALHGLQTLLQLIQPAGDGFVLPAVTVNDSPRFRWRGLMIDCSRHFEPIPVLERNIDALAAVKLNVFHWHLTDDQGFRIESKLYPKLTALGSDGLFYTQDEARDLVAYARARGIRVVPEFEMPGHSTAWLVAYPELASGITPDGIRREFGISKVALDPTREETYAFIQRFLAEMTTVFPDRYMHIGGDETQSPDWKSSPRILAFMQAHDLHDPDALQAYFNQRVLKILTGLHKHMVGWDEILNPALPHDVVVQSWRGQASLSAGAKEGYQGLLSAGYYLDAMQPAGQHFLVDPIPTDATLTPDQQKLILGGEIAMWAEQINAETIDSRLWPRSAAIAERLWSPATDRDVDDMYRRLDATSVELETLGLHHLSQEDASLRALAGIQNIDALRTFASAFEPVPFPDRYKQQRTSQLTVLDLFVDAVRPDPPSHHQTEERTHALLASHGADARATNELIAQFQAWQACVPAAVLQINSAPLLANIRNRPDQLAELARIGLEAIIFITHHQQPPPNWQAHATANLEAAQQPGGVVRFTFINPLKQLIDAASSPQR